MKIKKWISAVTAFTMFVPAAVMPIHADETDTAPAIGTEWKFDFGAEEQTAVENYYSVTPKTEYSKNIVDGLQFGLIGGNLNDYKLGNYEDGVTTKQGQYINYLAAGEGTGVSDDRIGVDPVLPEGQIEGLYPIRFSMAAENNAYYEVKVTITGLDIAKAATANVFSEKRHPIVTNSSIEAGASKTVSFTASPQKVLVKNRSGSGTITYNDTKLNVEVVGDNIAVSSIEVKKVAPEGKIAIWCYDDSTGCDYASELPYFPSQNYGGTAQFLSKYLSEDIVLVNQGDGGINAASLSYFNCAKANIKEGDYIYVQYGHNHKTDGAAGYVQALHNYYDHAVEKNANVIFVGPIDRHNSSQYTSSTNTWSSTLASFSKAARYYTELLITGGKELAETFASKARAAGTTSISDSIYAWADEEIAKGIDPEKGAKNVAFIDLNRPTLDWLGKICDEVKTIKEASSYSAGFSDYYFQARSNSKAADGTHENDYGADFTASFFFDEATALINKADKSAIETVEANVLSPLLADVRSASPDKVPENIVLAGGVPNAAYPTVYQPSNAAELPTFIKDVTFNEDGTVKSVKVLKQESKLVMGDYGVVEIVIKDKDENVKGTLYSSQVDNTWSNGTVTEITSFTGDKEIAVDDDAGDIYTAQVFRAPDSESGWPLATLDKTTAYSDPYVYTDIEGYLITNEDGNEVEDFDYYTAVYTEGALQSSINGNNGWRVAGNNVTNQKLAKDGETCYLNLGVSGGNSFWNCQDLCSKKSPKIIYIY